MVTFPIHVPKIEVDLLPDETLTVERRDLWGLLPEVGAECVTGFYYRYQGEKSPPLYFGRSRVVARFKWQGRDGIEAHGQTWNPGDVERADFWDSARYYLFDSEGFRCVRDIYRNKRDGSTTLWDITEPIEPWRLTVEMEGGGMSIHEGEERRTMNVPWKITGVARVSIGNGTFRCLRKLVHHQHGPGWASEVFIADNGRTVLTRGYESEKGDQFEYVKGQPEMVIDGVTYRLLCDMIPDHVFPEASVGPFVQSAAEVYGEKESVLPVPSMTRFGRV